MVPKTTRERSHPPRIGIVGGVGPHAGYDLALKILQETVASTDQEHLPVVAISESHNISDRTSYLLGETDVNPGHALALVVKKLENVGASVVGIPCNAAHASRIFSVILQDLQHRRSPLKLLHMVEEVGTHIRRVWPEVSRVGLLSTKGTALCGVYQENLGKTGFEVVLPSPATRESVHDAVYNPAYGIKARSQPVTPEARAILESALDELRSREVATVVLGCTEIPLALREAAWRGIQLIDSTRVLARALIRETYPEKLRRF